MTKKRLTKYDTHVEPRLIEIEGWARDGLIDEQIAKNLGIAYSTFREYKNKHPALSAALKKGKEVVDRLVENALLKRALGYEYEEVKTLIEEVDGKKKKKIEKTKKHFPADVSAGIFWLRNRKGKVWSNREQIDADKIKADIEYTKEKTKLLKGEKKDLSLLEELFRVSGSILDDTAEPNESDEIDGNQGGG
ncbi:MAG: transposase [Candidatus Alkaliphilus sp. MAG34]